MKKIILAALLGAVTLSATAAEKETIRFATEATYAPFEMFDKKQPKSWVLTSTLPMRCVKK